MTIVLPRKTDGWLTLDGGGNMNLTIELTPEEARRVENARTHGVDVDAVVKGILAGFPDTPLESPNPVRPGQRTLELLARWREEDATDDPEELERRDRENEEFSRNLRANRVSFRIPKV